MYIILIFHHLFAFDGTPRAFMLCTGHFAAGAHGSLDAKSSVLCPSLGGHRIADGEIWHMENKNAIKAFESTSMIDIFYTCWSVPRTSCKHVQCWKVIICKKDSGSSCEKSLYERPHMSFQLHQGVVLAQRTLQPRQTKRVLKSWVGCDFQAVLFLDNIYTAY